MAACVHTKPPCSCSHVPSRGAPGLQDLVIPSYKNPVLIGATPLLGARPLERTVLCSFQGNVGKQRLAHYSRGIRQRLHHLARQHQWQERHRIVIADSADGAGDYSTLLSSSVFCLHVPGAGPALMLPSLLLGWGLLPVAGMMLRAATRGCPQLCACII